MRNGIVCGGFLEANDDFVGLRVTEFFAGDAFDRFGVMAQGLDIASQETVGFVFLADFRAQFVDLFAPPLVLLDKRQVQFNDSDQTSDQAEGDDSPSQLVPDAEVNFHFIQLSPRTPGRKEDNPGFGQDGRARGRAPVFNWLSTRRAKDNTLAA